MVTTSSAQRRSDQNFLSCSVGGQGLAYTDPGVKTPISMSGYD